MSPLVLVRPRAHVDLAEIADFIAEDSPGAAIRFLEAAESTFEILARSPEIGSVCGFSNPRLRSVRRWPVRRFRRYLVFYRAVNSGIDVIRLLHGARDIEAIFSEVVE